MSKCSDEAFFQWMCGPKDMPFPDENTKAPPIEEQIKRYEQVAMLNRCFDPFGTLTMDGKIEYLLGLNSLDEHEAKAKALEATQLRLMRVWAEDGRRDALLAKRDRLRGEALNDDYSET